jgi:hypothetical protein
LALQRATALSNIGFHRRSRFGMGKVNTMESFFGEFAGVSDWGSP